MNDNNLPFPYHNCCYRSLQRHRWQDRWQGLQPLLRQLLWGPLPHPRPPRLRRHSHSKSNCRQYLSSKSNSNSNSLLRQRWPLLVAGPPVPGTLLRRWLLKGVQGIGGCHSQGVLLMGGCACFGIVWRGNSHTSCLLQHKHIPRIGRTVERSTGRGCNHSIWSLLTFVAGLEGGWTHQPRAGGIGSQSSVYSGNADRHHHYHQHGQPH